MVKGSIKEAAFRMGYASFIFLVSLAYCDSPKDDKEERPEDPPPRVVSETETPAEALLSPPWWQWDHLSDEWWGIRSGLEEKGVAFELFYNGEVFGNVSGGRRHKAEYLDKTNLQLSLDMQKLIGWPGASVFVYGLGTQGGDPSKNVGEIQTISNIEAFNTWKLYEAWLQQSLCAEDRLTVKAGLYDLNSEFDALRHGSPFLNSSHGIGPEFAQSGRNGPSIFPTTSAGIRLRAQPTDNIYLQAAVLDGVAGDPGNPRGTQVIWHKDDGVLVAAEVAYFTGIGENVAAPYGKYAVGGWYYTARFADVLAVDNAGNPVERRGNHGIYCLAEQTVYCEDDSCEQGLGLFGRIGIADGKVNQFYLYTGAGVVYTGLVPGLNEDRIGFAVAAAYNGSDFKKARRLTGNPVTTAEIILEFTYLAQVTPWLALQPELQWVFHPGTNPDVKDAFAVGVRFTVFL